MRLTTKIIVISLLICSAVIPQTNSTQTEKISRVPIILSGDTLFSIYSGIGVFDKEQRANAIEEGLSSIIKSGGNPDEIQVKNTNGISSIVIGSKIIMSVTDSDAVLAGKPRSDLVYEDASIIKTELKDYIKRYTAKTLLKNAGIVVLLIVIIFFLFWLMRKVFPKGYEWLEKIEGSVIRSIKIRSEEILSAEKISAFFIVILKLIRLAIALAVLYFFITFSLGLFPWTHSWNVKPILAGILSAILLTAVTYAVYKAVNAIYFILQKKIDEGKGTLIKSVKVKNLEVVSEDRILEGIKFSIKILSFVSYIVVTYFYVTILFSFFSFTRNWAATLVSYIMVPLGKVIESFVSFLPNLFSIIVILFVTRYVLKFIKFIFTQIENGAISFPQFPDEWAIPTYKIVRFLVMAFAAVVIFPYLPGSNSDFFKGISVFLGVLFSLGSTSAIANVVGGIVLTYMRPFKIGDRVRIADTMGDIVEKTLLVTRIKTIKNVNITIPNSMVLGSHIINFSSSAKQSGLILHTTVTIGYDAEWRKVHELLKAAAGATDDVLKTPVPFILQTSLDDFFVSYELNAYTDKPNKMAQIYSDLHQNIQDKFNEAGVEIMSPHYTGVRDGNQDQIPEDYLPKNYTPRSFKFSPFGDINKKPDQK
jgi:small-conductance mechanosensitive channel